MTLRAGAALLVFAVFMVMLALEVGPGVAPAGAVQGDSWVLVGATPNPGGEPTEFVVGVTPNYYESPRFDGTFSRYTITTTSISSHQRSVEREFEYWNMTTTTNLVGPPSVMIPGETVTLGASGTATGSVFENGNPIEQFQFFAEGAMLEDETFFAIGLNATLTQRSAEVTPSFVVPEPTGPDDEILITAGYWNCGACQVAWVFRAELAASTDIGPPAPGPEEEASLPPQASDETTSTGIPGVTERDGNLYLDSPPGEFLVISREDLPAWARNHIAVQGASIAVVGPPDTIGSGDPRVLIDGNPVARIGDTTIQGGVIVEGSDRIFVNGVAVAVVGSNTVNPQIGNLVPRVGGPISGTGANPDPAIADYVRRANEDIRQANEDLKQAMAALDGYAERTIALADDELRAGDTRIEADSSGFEIGDGIAIGNPGGPLEAAVVADKGSIILDRPLQNDYPAGTLLIEMTEDVTALMAAPNEDNQGAGPEQPDAGGDTAQAAGQNNPAVGDDGSAAPMTLIVLLVAVVGGFGIGVFVWRQRKPGVVEF